MHRSTQPALVVLSLSLAFAVPAIALADRAPNPRAIEEKRIEEVKPPPSPDAPAKADTPPLSPSDPLASAAKTETKTETKTDAAAKDAKKTESGGMCRAGAPAGGWELLVLVALGLRARRRR